MDYGSSDMNHMILLDLASTDSMNHMILLDLASTDSRVRRYSFSSFELNLLIDCWLLPARGFLIHQAQISRLLRKMFVHAAMLVLRRYEGQSVMKSAIIHQSRRCEIQSK
eukprot:2399262-Pleurochrysis_carterae.AAC.1